MRVVVTDLDGTLLEHETYAWEDARQALDLLRRSNVPIVFCTSKTRAETEFWQRRLDIRHPFIVENGGAVLAPPGHFPLTTGAAAQDAGYDAWPLGSPYPELTAALARAAAASGCRVRGFAQMDATEIARECRMPLEQAELALQRQYDEPFLILDPDRTAGLLAAIEQEGMRHTQGGRFYHILGNYDKAAALRLLVGLYRRRGEEVETIGLGDGLNDAAFLNAVDIPILVRSPRLERLQAAVPRGVPTERPGPQGWNEAILRLMDRG
jgi:mannosyl-3-phosphoglycerate phosphatase family protein